MLFNVFMTKTAARTQMSGELPEEPVSMSGEVAALAERGEWQSAASAASSILNCSAEGIAAVEKDDQTVRWLASVWAYGAWERGCVAECARALQLARGLSVSASREQRLLIDQSPGLFADVEEEAECAAVNGNYLCCSIELGVRCGGSRPSDMPLPVLGDGSRSRNSDDTIIGSGATSGITRLALKKLLVELGRLVKTCAERANLLRCDVEGKSDRNSASWKYNTEAAEAWSPTAFNAVVPLLEVVLTLCCNYSSACLRVGVSPGSADKTGADATRHATVEMDGGGTGILACAEACHVVESVLSLMANVGGFHVDSLGAPTEATTRRAEQQELCSKDDGAKRRKLNRDGDAQSSIEYSDKNGGDGITLCVAALQGWERCFLSRGTRCDGIFEEEQGQTVIYGGGPRNSFLGGCEVLSPPTGLALVLCWAHTRGVEVFEMNGKRRIAS